jgi:hypothetical protein
MNKKNYTLKISAGDHPLKKIPSDHGNMITRYDAAGRFQGQNLKTKSQIENKTQKLRF